MNDIPTFDQWAADLQQVEPTERVAWIHRTLKSKRMLHVFGRFFFPHIVLSAECAPFHHELHAELARKEDSAIIEPREHAKTTWLRIDTLHDIVYQIEPFIVFVSATLNDSQMSFAFVKTELEVNRALKQVYGNLVPPFNPHNPRKWSDTHFQTLNSVICVARGGGRGRGLNIGGKRPTKVIVDDMENDEAVRNKERRKKLEHWFFNVLIPSIDSERGYFKMVGTILHYDCLLLKVYQKYGGVRRAALEQDGKPSMEGQPIWPGWWTLEKLMKRKRDMGSFPFSQEYLNEPMSDEGADVKLAWVKRVHEVKLFDKQNKSLFSFHSALDPAISQKEHADDSAIVTVGRKKDTPPEEKRIVVLNAIAGRWGMTGTIKESKRIYDRYPEHKFLCENVAFQEGLRQMLNQAGVPAKPCNPRGKDKRSRLLKIVGLIEFGNIEFMDGTEDLISQLVQFPNTDNDDLVDAFVMAVESAIGEGGGFMFEEL